MNQLVLLPHPMVPAMGDRFAPVDLEHVLDHRWPSEACLVSYRIEGEDRIPRLRKNVLAELSRNHRKVVVDWLVFDYDRPKHGDQKSRWPDAEVYEDWVAGPLQIALGDLPWPTVVYQTPHGARVMWRLAKSATPGEAEAHYHAMLELLAIGGVEFDAACADWTRLFRAPAVVHPKLGPTWEMPSWVEPLVTPGNVLDASTLPVPEAEPEPPDVGDTARPAASELHELLFRPVAGRAGRSALTSTYRALTKEIRKDHTLEWVLTEPGTPPPWHPGERNSELTRAVGRLLVRFRQIEPFPSPRLLYALIARHVEAMPGEDNGRAWPDIAWDIILRLWQKDRYELLKTSEHRRKTEVRMIEGFRRMLAAGGATGLEELAALEGKTPREFVRSRSILAFAGNHYLLNKQGQYSKLPCSASRVVPQIVNSLGLEWWYGADGSRDEARRVLRTCSVDVRRVSKSVGIERPTLTDTGDEEGWTLMIPAYHIEPIEPEFVPEVDEWLRILVGESDADTLLDWIALAQRHLTRPLPALALLGAADTGKTLFANLLASRFGPGPKVDGATAFGRFNASVADNPVIHVDEGFGDDSTVKVDERFRTYVTGGPLDIEQKYAPVTSVRIYARMVLTSNSDNVVRSLAGKRDLDSNSIEALQRRLLILHCSRESANYLRRLDAQLPAWDTGPCLALRHFAWLAENRVCCSPEARHAGSHMLLNTAGSSGLQVLARATQGTVVAELCKAAIVAAVEAPAGKARHAEGVAIVSPPDKALFVRSELLRTWMRTHFADSIDFGNLGRANRTAVARALGALAPDGSAEGTSQRRVDGSRTRGFLVCPLKLLRFALAEGCPAPRLEELIESLFGEEVFESIDNEV